MSLSMQGEGSNGVSSFQSGKRRRGRPCRDSFLNHTEAALASPGFGVGKQYLRQASGSAFQTDAILGQSVTGFVEATFDAGYLLSVRIGKSSATLRGLVFKPGYYPPVTAVNDVTPHLPMIRRGDDVSVSSGNLSFLHGREDAMQAAVTVPSKRKYASRKEAPPASLPVEVSAVDSFAPQPPVVQESQIRKADAPMVESSYSISSDKSAPVCQIHLVSESDSIKDTPRTEQDEDIQKILQEKGQAVSEGCHIPNPMKTWNATFQDSKEKVNAVTADSLAFSVQETGSINESRKHAFFTPALNCVAGRMTELLQAVEEKQERELPRSRPPVLEFDLLESSSMFETKDAR